MAAAIVLTILGGPALLHVPAANETKAREARRERTYRALLEKYDPFGLELGATLKAVEARLGPPAITARLDADCEMRYYGSVEHGLMGNRNLMWLVLVFDKDKVIRIFADDFVDYGKIKKLEEGLAGGGGT
ncbi:MAG: hypothetical protein GX174_02835 [Lentisphaerae bacterium]|jgi:hypothetical protein|nr:hypothetical protein [Lentisphaerota bacterium]